MSIYFYKTTQNPKLLNNLMWIGNSGTVSADPTDQVWKDRISTADALLDKPYKD